MKGWVSLDKKNNLHKLLDDVCFNFISVWNSLAFLLLTKILTWRKYTWWILPTDTTSGENYWNSVLVPGIDCIEEKIELSLLFSLIQSSALYLISLLLYRWIRLGKDFLRKRFQNGLLVSSQTSSFHKVFGSFKVLPGYLWIIKGHRLFCLDLKLSERVTAIKRTLCVNKWMKNTGKTQNFPPRIVLLLINSSSNT